MSYQALARKYRPQSFRDIIGQETVVRTLQNAIQDQRIHHAYLFSGVRGVGKTTAARILAKALNCVQGPATEPCNNCTICQEITEGIDLDVREIDAATYTGVDNVRELREVTQFQPARDRYRVFIIDEAHMLSTAAWNALLKVIEEPPPHVIFMFATTEMHKVPQTIISRVQRQILRKITLDELITRLAQICESEGITADRKALEIVARRGEGSVRDSLSLLDQIIAFSGRTITPIDVATILGLSDPVFFSRIVGLIAEGDHAGVLDALQEASEAGRDFRMLYRDLLNFVRSLLLIAGGANEAMLSAQPEDLETMRAAAEKFSYSELLRIANLLLRDDETVNKAEHQRLAVEIALLKATTFPRLRSVEEALAGGATTQVSAKQVSAPRAKSTSAATNTAADPSAFLTLLQKKRPLLAGYATGAKQSRKEGNRLILSFDDVHLAEPLLDARAALSEIASEAFGGTIEVVIETAGEKSEGRREEDKPSALRDDPVLKAFQKHLGGELLKENR
ncbi:MAG TPA: DNA polymerase III subunit gamma/tau [Thermoanaerobaculia bacterium]|nr:DNA polymerase III subunit gamma/tau [Thermoanaerobaculia bacterium]